MGLGKLFDVVFKNKKMFNYFFYGMLFSLFIPLSTPLWFYLLFLTGLFLFHFFVLEKKDLDLNFMILGKLLLVLGLILMENYYYKKEIPIYSYGLYFVSLIGYAIYKSDMTFFLEYFCNSQVVAALVFLAPLSLFSPYSSKRKSLYSFLIGGLILPLSIKFTFHEGVYLAILISNLCLLFLGFFGSNFKRT